MASDVLSISDETYQRWLLDAGVVSDPDAPTEENLIRVFCDTMRTLQPEARARGFVDLANMALAMADKTLGSQVPVTRCLIVDLH